MDGNCALHDIVMEGHVDHEGRIRGLESDVGELKNDFNTTKESIFIRLDNVCQSLERVISVLIWGVGAIITGSCGFILYTLVDKVIVR